MMADNEDDIDEKADTLDEEADTITAMLAGANLFGTAQPLNETIGNDANVIDDWPDGWQWDDKVMPYIKQLHLHQGSEVAIHRQKDMGEKYATVKKQYDEANIEITKIKLYFRYVA